MLLASRRLNTERALGASVLVEPPVSRKAVPQMPVSLPPTLVGLIVRLNGVSQRPTKRLPKPPLRPRALLRVHKSPSPLPAVLIAPAALVLGADPSRQSMVDTHW